MSSESLPDKHIPPPSKLDPTAELQDAGDAGCSSHTAQIKEEAADEAASSSSQDSEHSSQFWVSQNGQVHNHRLGAGIRQERCEARNASSSHPSRWIYSAKLKRKETFIAYGLQRVRTTGGLPPEFAKVPQYDGRKQKAKCRK